MVHKGYVPTLTEATSYAEYVYDYIVGTLKVLKSSLGTEIDQACKDEEEQMLKSIPAGVTKRSVAAPTMIWLLGPSEKFGKQSFREALTKRKEEHKDELERRLYDLENEDDEAA